VLRTERAPAPRLEEVYVLLKDVRNMGSQLVNCVVYSAPLYHQHFGTPSGSLVNKSNDKSPEVTMERCGDFVNQVLSGNIFYSEHQGTPEVSGMRRGKQFVVSRVSPRRRRSVSTIVRSKKLILDRGRDGSS
jgi:hypothetical protein